MRYDSLFERFYFEDNPTPLLEQTLREMGGITIDIGYNILSPLYNKSITPDYQEIEKAIDQIFLYTRGGKRVFFDENRNSMDKETWLDTVFNKISNMKNAQISKNDTEIKRIFLARMSKE